MRSRLKSMKLLAVVRPLKKFQCVNHFSVITVNLYFSKIKRTRWQMASEKGGLELIVPG